MAALKALSDKFNILVTSELVSIDCLFFIQVFPGSWCDEWFFFIEILTFSSYETSESYLNAQLLLTLASRRRVWAVLLLATAKWEWKPISSLSFHGHLREGEDLVLTGQGWSIQFPTRPVLIQAWLEGREYRILLPLWPLLTLQKKQATLPLIRDEVPAPHSSAWSTSLQPDEGGSLGSPLNVCWLGWGWGTVLSSVRLE